MTVATAGMVEFKVTANPLLGTSARTLRAFTEFSLEHTYNTYEVTNQSSDGYMEHGVSTKGVTVSISMTTKTGSMLADEVGIAELLRVAEAQSGSDNLAILTFAPKVDTNYFSLTGKFLLENLSISATHHEQINSTLSIKSSGAYAITYPELLKS